MDKSRFRRNGMHIGVSLSPFGHHPAAWRNEGASPAALDVGCFAAQVRKAESAALDFVWFADAEARRPQSRPSPQATPFEPTTLVAALATLSRRIGFVATAATGQHELYNLARRFASLDLISQGRVGWNLVASGPTHGWNEEYLAVVGALWDSWDDDAFLYDKAAGRFFTPEKMHVLNHRGEHFSVRGPLNVNRSPQGRPVICQVLNPETVPIATRAAELIMLAGASLPQNAELAAQLGTALAQQGRKRSDVRVLANVIPWIGATASAARAAIENLDALASLQEASPPEGAAAPPARCDVIGTPGEIADALQESFERHDIDGFTILPPVAPGGLDGFVDLVVPELCRRGLFRGEYQGSTLRDHLGLARPALPGAATQVSHVQR